MSEAEGVNHAVSNPLTACVKPIDSGPAILSYIYVKISV